MKRSRLAVGVLAPLVFGVVLASPHAARATLYDFTYTLTQNQGGGTNYSGVFDVSGTTVVGITGTSSLYGAITGLLAPHAFSGNDNQLSTTSPYVTFDGISFTLADGGDANFYLSSLHGDGEIANGALTGSFGTLAVSLVAVPEPVSLALFGVGLLGLGMVRRHANGDRHRASHPAS